jgi:hypothetical protein
MTDEIAFLQATVLELQAIAAAAPEIAGDLYRMAEDLEARMPLELSKEGTAVLIDLVANEIKTAARHLRVSIGTQSEFIRTFDAA